MFNSVVSNKQTITLKNFIIDLTLLSVVLFVINLENIRSLDSLTTPFTLTDY